MTGLKKLLALIASGEKVPKIGGLPVLVDNARYTNASTGKWDDYVSDSNYFLTGWYDTETTGNKSYTLGKVGVNGIQYPYARWFNDKTGNLVDYWSPDLLSDRTFSTPGQFVVATVYKPTAADYFLRDNTNQRYVFKGKNVT